MAIETATTKPPTFHGDTSGPAWYAEFFNWVISATASQADRVESLGTYMRGVALTWFNGLTEAQKKDLHTLRPLFFKEYPEKKTLDFFVVEDNATEAFQSFLDTKVDVKTLTSSIEVEVKDKTGRLVKQTVCYFHNWIREAYEKASRLPDTKMDDATKVFYISRALPHQVAKFLPADLTELVPYCKAVINVRPEHVRRECENDQRLSALESKVPTRATQGAHGTGSATYQPTTYTPTTAPGTNKPASTPSRGKAVRGVDHLTFPANPSGNALYAKALDSYTKAHPGESVSANLPYPLTPGTLAPGNDVCDHCASKGHIRPNCPIEISPLPERERKYRGINSAAQRREDRDARDARFLAIGWNPAAFYYDDEAGNEAGMA